MSFYFIGVIIWALVMPSVLLVLIEREWTHVDRADRIMACFIGLGIALVWPVVIPLVVAVGILYFVSNKVVLPYVRRVMAPKPTGYDCTDDKKKYSIKLWKK